MYVRDSICRQQLLSEEADAAAPAEAAAEVGAAVQGCIQTLADPSGFLWSGVTSRVAASAN